MNKETLIKNIAGKTGLSKKDIGTVIESFQVEVAEALQNGDKVQLIGFGSFEPRKRAARKGRNPQTGEEIEIPETTVPAFKASNKLKEAIK